MQNATSGQLTQRYFSEDAITEWHAGVDAVGCKAFADALLTCVMVVSPHGKHTLIKGGVCTPIENVDATWPMIVGAEGVYAVPPVLTTGVLTVLEITEHGIRHICPTVLEIDAPVMVQQLYVCGARLFALCDAGLVLWFPITQLEMSAFCITLDLGGPTMCQVTGQQSATEQMRFWGGRCMEAVIRKHRLEHESMEEDLPIMPPRPPATPLVLSLRHITQPRIVPTCIVASNFMLAIQVRDECEGRAHYAS